MGMQTKRFGYFRLRNEGRVHYLDEVEGRSTLRSLCGKDTRRGKLIPANFEETERDFCRTCKRIQGTVFWGWEQMI